jgi:nitrate reductase delta subunit
MSEAAAVLQGAYTAIAELWCSPRDVDTEEARRGAEEAIAGLQGLDREAAGLLSQFLQEPRSEEKYVELFELDPRCPLYLGSHAFAEPKTCAQAGISDRNGYMIELLGIYRHFGLTPNGKELPDYLPLVVELLALTAGSEDRLRRKLIEEYVVPYLPPVRARLQELETPYLRLLEALERVLKLDVASLSERVTHA